ncbi:MAG: NUDIX hydrolase [Deltaproteobacteria bacterium]|nr:NUDIX hydrolase [Deltaproteobacteria bacterium]
MSETVFSGRVFKVVREEVDLPSGRRARLDLVKHPGAAAVVPIDDQGRVILLRQYRHAAGGWIWEIPAGTLDPGEDMEQCARRELAEETGYSAESFEKIAELLPAPGYTTERIHVFVARDLSPAKQSLDPGEVLEVHRVDLAEARAMVADGRIQDSKTVCGVLLASARGQE